MILDHLLDGTHANTMIAYARDADGRIVGFQRYAMADQGRELSLDVPYRVARRAQRRRRAAHRRRHDLGARSAERYGCRWRSPPSPSSTPRRSATSARSSASAPCHELDRWIRLESLYRFLRKFNAFGKGRYVMLRPTPGRSSCCCQR